MNRCTWKASLVTLFDGREVMSNSHEYRAECEARHVLAKSSSERAELLEKIAQVRGADALVGLKKTMARVEPAYVLNLPDKIQRHAYLARVEFLTGQKHAELLRVQILSLHERRKNPTKQATENSN